MNADATFPPSIHRTALLLVFQTGLGALAAWFLPFPAPLFLVVLCVWGVLAGWIAGRQVWLAGLSVGLVASMVWTVRGAWQEALRHATFSPASVGAVWGGRDFLFVGFTGALLATAVTILGALVGGWLRGARAR